MSIAVTPKSSFAEGRDINLSRHGYGQNCSSRATLILNAKRNLSYGRILTGNDLSLGLAAADEGDFHFLVAMGTGDVDGDELAEYAFGHCSDHRVDIVEALVQQIEASFQALQFLIS